MAPSHNIMILWSQTPCFSTTWPWPNFYSFNLKTISLKILEFYILVKMGMFRTNRLLCSISSSWYWNILSFISWAILGYCSWNCWMKLLSNVAKVQLFIDLTEQVRLYFDKSAISPKYWPCSSKLKGVSSLRLTPLKSSKCCSLTSNFDDSGFTFLLFISCCLIIFSWNSFYYTIFISAVSSLLIYFFKSSFSFGSSCSDSETLFLLSTVKLSAAFSLFTSKMLLFLTFSYIFPKFWTNRIELDRNWDNFGFNSVSFTLMSSYFMCRPSSCELGELDDELSALLEISFSLLLLEDELSLLLPLLLRSPLEYGSPSPPFTVKRDLHSASLSYNLAVSAAVTALRVIAALLFL